MFCFPFNSDNTDDWAEALRTGFQLQRANFQSPQQGETISDHHDALDEFNSDGVSRATKLGYKKNHMQHLRPSKSMDPMIHATTALIPNGIQKSMEEEFKGTSYWKEYHYVVYEAAREGGPIYEDDDVKKWFSKHVRDRGHGGKTLKDFAELKKAKEANLTLAETASLRLYTSPWFSVVNKILRLGEDISPWSTTISVLISALLKLSNQRPPKKLYRAMKGVLAEGSKKGTSHIEKGFMSCSDDTEIACFYSGNPNIAAVILCIESNFASRAGYIGEIAQNPDDKEWTFPPFTALEILDIEQIGMKTCVHVRPTISQMRHYTDKLRYPWSSPNDPLTWSEYDMVKEAVEKTSTSTSSPEFFKETKFSSSLNELLSGAPKTAALGLEAYMGQSMALPADGIAAIKKEIKYHGTDSDKEWLKYILYESASSVQDDWGVRDEGHNGLDLEAFYQHPNARTAGLTRAHILALRLYTTRFYLSLNNPLRKFKRNKNGDLIHPLSMETPHKFPKTIAFVDDGIRRLRAVEAEENRKSGVGSKEVVLWRGMRDIKVSDEFIHSGGVEIAPMSTTYSLDIAITLCRKRQSKYNLSYRDEFFHG